MQGGAQSLRRLVVSTLQEGLADDVYAATNRGIFYFAQRGHAVARASVPGRDALAQNHDLKMISGKLWIAGGEYGVWSERTFNVPIRVMRAWYQTLWFKCLIAAIAIAGILALVQGRTVVLRRRQRELECQVAERTEELAVALLTAERANTLECYLADTRGQLHIMQSAIMNGDHATLERCAHSLKSTGDTVGARELKSISAKIEAHARARRRYGTARSVGEQDLRADEPG